MSGKTRGAFSPAVIIGVILVGVFSFSAFLVLSAFEPDLSSGKDGRAHALSTSAVGFAGAVRLARATGAAVTVGRTVGARERQHSLVIVTPERPLAWSEVRDAGGARTLIILPKWMVGPDPAHRGWVSRLEVLPPQMLAELMKDVAANLEVAHASGAAPVQMTVRYGKIAPAGAIEQLQTITSAALDPIVMDSAGRTVLARVIRDGRATSVYVLADPDFLNTQGIANLDNARAGMSILDVLRPNNEAIVFDVTLNGLGGARSALRLAFEPPFLGATFALVIAAALLGWRASLRFGPSAPVQRAIALGKEALANNSAALIRLAGRERMLGAGYARLVGATVLEAAGFGRKDEAEAAALLDRLGETQGAHATFTQLAAEAAAAKTPQQMLDAARKLHAWKEEIARATG